MSCSTLDIPGQLFFLGLEDLQHGAFAPHGIVNTLLPDNRYNIVLPSDRVDYAEFHGYPIFYRYPDERSGNLPEGYYLRLYEGVISYRGGIF